MSPDTEAAPSSRWLAWALGCWLVATAMTFGGLVALSHSGPWLAATQPYRIAGSQLTVRGSGRADGSRLVLEGASPDGAAAGVISFPTPIEARNFRVATIKVSGAHPAGGASLIWRVMGHAKSVGRVELVSSGGRILPVALGAVDGWSGTIVGLGIVAKGDFRIPYIIESIELRPSSAWNTIEGIVSDWFEFEPWDGGSIHFMAGGNPALKHPLPLFLGVSLIAGLCLYLLAVPLGYTRFEPKVAVAIALLGWIVIDARWQWNLWKQLDITRFQYAGKTWEEKRLAAEDGELFAFMREVKARIGDAPAHVFVFSDEEYGRVRGAYHLYPKNVSVQPRRQSLLPAAAFRAGDVLVVYRKRGIEYDQASKRLRWEGTQSVSAELLLFSRGSAVFRVLGAA